MNPTGGTVLKVISTTPFQFAGISGKLDFPHHSLTLIVKGTFSLDPAEKTAPVEDPPFPTGDEYYPDRDHRQGSLRYESDFAWFKPRADLLLAGKCYTPEGKPIQMCPVTFQVGSRSRSLAVFGDRRWRRNKLGLLRITDPEPFTEMDLRYENSFGGTGYGNNPAGKGYGSEQDETGKKVRPLPNIEDPNALIDSPRCHPEPGGFGPLSRNWEQRDARRGTYRGNYLKERWPWFPEDFDWSHFNAAPQEMQVEGYLRGDETLYLENLHPRHSQYHSQLPGIKVRCFLNALAKPGEQETSFEEVSMNLDTLWVDMEAEKLVLVWRGWTKVLSEDYEEIQHVFIMSEPLAQEPQSVEECRRLYLDELSEYEREWGTGPDEAEPVPEAAEVVEQEAGKELKGDSTSARRDAESEEEARRQKEELRKRLEKQSSALLAQLGINLGNLPPEVQQRTREQHARIISRLTEDDPKKAMMGEKARLESQLKGELAKMGIDADNLPPVSEKAKAEQARFMKEMGPANFDVSGDPELSRVWTMLAAVMPRMGIDPENLTPLIAQSKKHMEKIKGQLGVEEKTPEEEEQAQDEESVHLTREVIQERAARGESFAGEDLRNLDLSELELKGIVFTGTIFSGTNLAGADLEASNLTGADLRNSNLGSSNLTGANLAAANLSSANLEKACLRDADITEGDLTHATLAGAELTDAVFEKATMAGAVLDGVEAEDAYFSGADLSGASFKNAELSRADFSTCRLDKTDFQGANLSAACVEGAAGVGINFSEVNLSALRASEGCDFSQASFRKAQGSESIWHTAKLFEADFSYAQMEGADFAEASLEGANLYAADMKFSRFRKANLRRAELVQMNLFEGSLEKADLTEANLSGSNLYGAEFLEAILERTNLKGANLKRTKLHG